MRLSVVIPTLGRRGPLARTLERLERQTLAHDAYEVIVVADATAPADALDAVVGRRPFEVRLLKSRVPGASAARNVGWRDARAPRVLFMGDDILAAPELLERHVAGEEGVLGRVRWAPEIRVTPFMRWLDAGIQFDFGAIEAGGAEWFHFYTANVSVPREALERVDGFDEEAFPFLYEDLDLGHRLHEAGVGLRYDRRALGDHLHPTTLEGWSGRAAAIATAERTWVTRYPEMPAYFHDRFAAAAEQPPRRGLLRRLLPLVGREAPVLGRRVWDSADAYYLQRLAPVFLEQWDRDAAAQTAARPRR